MSDLTMMRRAAPTAQAEPAGEADSPAYRGDVTVYRIVVVILGLVVLASKGGALFCEFSSTAHEIPQFLVALGSGALGALAGLFAPSPLSVGK